MKQWWPALSQKVCDKPDWQFHSQSTEDFVVYQKVDELMIMLRKCV